MFCIGIGTGGGGGSVVIREGTLLCIGIGTGGGGGVIREGILLWVGIGDKVGMMASVSTTGAASSVGVDRSDKDATIVDVD